MEAKYYYHAGTALGDDDMRWSYFTRKTPEAAEREARKMAGAFGGRPVVEYWDRSHGLRPGDSDVVSGCYFPRYEVEEGIS